MRTWIYFLLTLFFMPLLFGAPSKGQTRVNFYNWSEYINPQIPDDFQKSTGIKLVQSYFDDTNLMKAKLMTRNNGYDVVLPSLAEMQQELQAGLFRPLNKKEIPNLKYVDPILLAKTAQIDPGNQYGVIYTWGTIGIGYNVDMIHKILGPDVNPDDWKYVLDPKYLKKFQKCGVAFIDMPFHVYGVTLFYLGLNPNSHNIQDYVKATQYLMSIRPYLTYFSNSNYIYDLASGNLCMVLGYSGDTMRAVHFASAVQGVHLKYVVPKSGAPIWFDMLAVPRDAPDPDAAMAFINYLLQPQVAAMQSNFLYQPNPVPDSKPYLNPMLKDPNITPSTATIQNKLFEILMPPPKINQEMNRMWLQVRYGLKE